MQPDGELSARRAKENQAKILGLAGFIWPNRAFSKGYERKNKKNRRALRLARQVVGNASNSHGCLSSRRLPASRKRDSVSRNS
jgi:hypothetical protein